MSILLSHLPRPQDEGWLAGFMKELYGRLVERRKELPIFSRRLFLSRREEQQASPFSVAWRFR